jgi:hypothetical protein
MSTVVRRVILVPVSGLASVLGTSMLLGLAYYVYLQAGSPYKPVGGAALVVFEVVFYTMLAAAILGAALGAAVLAGALKAPRVPSVVLALFLTGILALPFLGVASVFNDCALGNGFPFGGSCD